MAVPSERRRARPGAEGAGVRDLHRTRDRAGAARPRAVAAGCHVLARRSASSASPWPASSPRSSPTSRCTEPSRAVPSWGGCPASRAARSGRHPCRSCCCVLAWPGWIELETALRVSTIVYLATLGLIGFAAVRRTSLAWWAQLLALARARAARARSSSACSCSRTPDPLRLTCAARSGAARTRPRRVRAATRGRGRAKPCARACTSTLPIAVASTGPASTGSPDAVGRAPGRAAR